MWSYHFDRLRFAGLAVNAKAVQFQQQQSMYNLYMQQEEKVSVPQQKLV